MKPTVVLSHDPPSGPRDAVIRTLVSERARFLAFVARRVGDRDLAEDLLQTAVLQAVRGAETLRDEERVVAWIYRILRNVLADHGPPGACCRAGRQSGRGAGAVRRSRPRGRGRALRVRW